MKKSNFSAKFIIYETLKGKCLLVAHIG